MAHSCRRQTDRWEVTVSDVARERGQAAGERIAGHGGVQAVAVARRHGVETMFTLSGAHVFPLYDAAVTGDAPMRLVDVRHEATAVFAAEATAKLTRTTGLAVVTAGPGVTNAVSAVATAHFNGSPLLVLGGRAPAARWGSGALQELDHPPLLAPVTKHAGTVADAARIAVEVDRALTLAASPHRGPVFLDVPMDELFSEVDVPLPGAAPAGPAAPDPDALDRVAALLAEADRPVLVVGSDVWAGGAEAAARRAAEALSLPVVANGMGRGVIPAGSPLLATRARSTAFGTADLVIVAGAPLDFRLGYGSFGGAPPAKVVHLADHPDAVAGHLQLAGSAAGDLGPLLDGLVDAAERHGRKPDRSGWLATLLAASDQAVARDQEALASDADPIHPARVYGELRRLLDDDAVVIGDGGDFVSFAGKYVEPRRPGCWLDPGPFGCLGTGLGYAVAARLARPSAQVVLLLGDGAAGFSLMDVDTLVRHRLPVVMVCGNNGIWGLEKHPMQWMYGYDVAADLQPGCRYDEVVRALGGAGELVTRPDEIGPALRRGFDAGVPYMVNVVTDPAVAYPRSTTGI
jgi:acetolactate synthase-1/2/3 large subunit